MSLGTVPSYNFDSESLHILMTVMSPSEKVVA